MGELILASDFEVDEGSDRRLDDEDRREREISRDLEVRLLEDCENIKNNEI